MVRHLVYLLIITLFTALFNVGCVSINLPGSTSKSADNVKFEDPAKPFKKVTIANADKAWRSNKTGNTISFSSMCDLKSTPSLEMIEDEYVSALGDPQREKSDVISYNDREARLTITSGKIEGIEVKVQTLIFVKNDCQYVLSYTGLKKKWDTEINFYDEFMNKFKAP